MLDISLKAIKMTVKYKSFVAIVNLLFLINSVDAWISNSNPSSLSSSISKSSLADIKLGPNFASNMSDFATRLYMNVNEAVLSTSALNSNSQSSQNSPTSAALQNIVISPLSVEMALALLLCGANGQTAKSMEDSLRLGHSSRQTVANQFHKLLSEIQDAQIANAIFIQKGYQIKSKFNKIAENKFDSIVQTVNFNNPFEVTSIINNWVANETKNEIKQLYSANSIMSTQTAFMVVNAIYFKGKWKTEFKMADTKASNFKMGDCTTYGQVDMMHTSNTFGYGKFSKLKAQILELPYNDANNLSMLIILPNKCNGLEKLEKLADTLDFSTINQYLRYDSVIDVTMPKFKIQFETSLINPLANMGFGIMFSPAANFKDMVELNSETTSNFLPITVSNVMHKAIIEVDEKGTVAAAVTGGRTRFHGLPGVKQTPVKFIADRPFMFVIRDPRSIYFIGKYVM